MAHPLVDRRDITAQRTAGPESEGVALAHLVGQLRNTNELLQRMLLQQRADIASQLCVTDREPAQAIMENWPIPGCRRFITRRTGEGGTFALTASTPLQVVDANETRLGGQIVVSGANSVTLFLTNNLVGPSGTPMSGATPQIFLAAAGGSWDFRLGNILWCGHVIAVAAAAGASSVTVAEV